MAQKNIDFGSYPDDPDADAIRTAFQKTQQNFTEIFAGLSDQGVQSINKTKQPGITVSAPTGNVLISADFACLTVQSSTLSLTVSNGSPATTQVISNSSQVLQINLPTTANLTNANVSGNLLVNGWANIGNASSNVIIDSGNLSVTGNITSGNISANNATFTTISGALSTASQPNITSLGTLSSLAVNGNITAANITANTGVFTGNGNGLSSLPGANVTGTVANATHASTANTVVDSAQPNITSVGTLSSLSVTGNVSAGNANLGNLVSANFFSGDGGLLSNVIGIAGPFIVNGTSYSNIISSGGNIVSAVGGATKLNVYSSGIEVTGLANISGNISAGNANLGNLAQANFFSGNGSSLSSITGANVTGTVANATHSSTANTVTTAAQPNITSVGTLTSLSVTGNVSAGNISSGGILSVTGNANVGNIGATNAVFTNVSGNGSGLSAIAGANVTGQVGNALVAGTVYTAAQPNITSVGTLSSLGVSGNITSGNVYANSGTVGASLLTGTLTTNAQPNITSVGTLSSLTVTGNITSGNANLGNLAKANYFQGDGSLLTNIAVAAGSYITNGTSNVAIPSSGGNVQIDVSGTSNVVVIASSGTNIAGTLNVTGNANIGNVGATRFVGNLQGNILTNSQTNITSVGTLTGLAVSGVSNLGPNSNVIITGGVSGAFLKTNGSGNLSWDTATLVPAQGSNTQIIFNDSGSLYAGNTGFTFDKTSGNVAIPGNLSVTSNVTANRFFGTVSTANQTSITEVGTLGYLIVTGNINAGNIIANGASLSSLNASNISSGTLAQARLANASLTLGNTTLTLGGTTTSLAGLSSVTSTTFVGALTGAATSAGTATTAGTVTTAAQPNITSVGTLTSLTVTNKVTAGQLQGDGGNISNIQAANIFGTVATATTAGAVTTAAQPNITSVGTLSSLTVSGNIEATYVYANAGAVVGNIIYALDTLQGNNLTVASNANIIGYLQVTGNAGISGNLAANRITTTGNISAGNTIVDFYHIRSVASGITAAGTTQASATFLNREINIVANVSAGQGVRLPTAVAGVVLNIVNTSANSLLVYPGSGGTINNLAANAAFTQPAGSSLQFISSSTTQWYTVGATYA